jgi:hypothetical protein
MLGRYSFSYGKDSRGAARVHDTCSLIRWNIVPGYATKEPGKGLCDVGLLEHESLKVCEEMTCFDCSLGPDTVTCS